MLHCSITLCCQLKCVCAEYCSVHNCNIPSTCSKLIPIFEKQNHISEFNTSTLLQTMNPKRQLKISAHCCQTGAKIFLAPFIRASNSIPVGQNFLYSTLFGCSLFLIWSSHRRMHTLVLRWLFSRLEILFSLIIILSNWQSGHLVKKSHYGALYN